MTTNDALSQSRPCQRCNGAGVTHSQWAKDNGYEGPAGKPCTSCDGAGQFPGLDVEAVMSLVLTGKPGAKNRRFRKSWPEKLNVWRNKDASVARAYYVWRLARFHGGADVTMPMTADMAVRSDPFRKELDKMADYVAKKVFGTDMAAAHRWGRAMGFSQATPKGLPASAYPGGPVADEDKPWWEAPELF